jgi:hypothetical protein
MKRTTKYTSKLGTAILAASFAFAMAPVTRAQVAANSDSPKPADVTNRLQDLEGEVSALQQEIAALKANENSNAQMTNASLALNPQQAPAAAAPAAAAPAAINLSGLLGSTTISGLVDTYYQYNNDHPFNNTSGFRFFDANTNAFSLGMVEMIVDKAPDNTSIEGRTGYHFSFGYGEAARAINGSDIGGDGSNFYVKEAYVDYLAPIGKGLTITVGKFVTPAGAEVIESNANWNYSRSILFYYAIPYFHMGANAKYVFNPKWSATGYMVDGWNNSIILHSASVGQPSNLTYGASLAYTPNAKWSVIENYLAGPVIDATNGTSKTFNDWKQLSDTVISYTPNAKWALMVNGDYGYGPRYDTLNGAGTAVASQSKAISYWGAAGYAKYTWDPKDNFTVRYEYFNDTNGYAGLLAGADGHAQEVTATYTYNLSSALMFRGEYRYDRGSLPVFAKGGIPFDTKDQHTASVSFVYAFSSANFK